MWSITRITWVFLVTEPLTHDTYIKHLLMQTEQLISLKSFTMWKSTLLGRYMTLDTLYVILDTMIYTASLVSRWLLDCRNAVVYSLLQHLSSPSTTFHAGILHRDTKICISCLLLQRSYGLLEVFSAFAFFPALGNI